MNRELFQKIHDVISVDPESFEMTSWETDGTLCGTTRCIAGWAVSIAADGPVFNPDYEAPNARVYSGEVYALAESMGIGTAGLSVPCLAERLLGLSEHQANAVFFNFDNARMAEYVEAAANGDTDRCARLLGA